MSRKSNKADSIGNPSAIANAMYDAQKKEITSSMVLSLSFIAAGLIVAAIGIFQYFHIKGNMTDSSENIDAMAWVVIAGVGLLVGIIGLVSIMKSVVSLGQIGSWAKEAESHASPFQAQKLHRKVAAMNQSQSMKTPDNKGAAEAASGQKPKFGFFKRGRENKETQSSEDLYYKYNPQEKQQVRPPEKAAPMMEQKFDYGINEAKKLTFADEFLKKNKRDPFAQYRKELGIEEEPEEEVKQKPKFIINGGTSQNPATAVTQNTSVQQQAAATTMPLRKAQEETPQFNEDTNTSGELNFSLSLSNDLSDAAPKNNSSVISYEQEQPNTTAVQKAAPLQFEEVSVSNSPYGARNESDDDIFFSAKTVTPPTQQTVTVQQQHFTPNLAAALDKAAPQVPAPPTVVLDLDYKKQRSSDDYDFSLYDEIDPNKAKKQKAAQAQTPKNDDMFFGSSPTNEPNEAPDTHQQFISSFMNNIENQENKNYALPNNEMPVQQQRPIQQQPQMSVQQQRPIQQQPQQMQAQQQIPTQQQHQQVPTQQKQKTGPFTQKKKTSTPPKSRNTKTKREKKSFSEMFLNNNGKSAEGNSDIVKNGTRAQRKFVDASEYDEWTCPECGKVNQEYVGVCACGARKPRPRNH